MLGFAISILRISEKRKLICLSVMSNNKSLLIEAYFFTREKHFHQIILEGEYIQGSF